ncbi:DUF4333 domain-containing protein [Nocardioides sp.]|uniref:DUF4333 domain-containing protein n=1 Tax=Nocardioides sp. TaxID=35761 RepID=UPI003516257A
MRHLAPTSRRLLAVAAVAVTLTVTGCSVEASIGDVTVDKDDLATQIEPLAEQITGVAPDSVTCPEDLKGEVDATATCTADFGGEMHDFTATVTSVDGTDVKFDLEMVS